MCITILDEKKGPWKEWSDEKKRDLPAQGYRLRAETSVRPIIFAPRKLPLIRHLKEKRTVGLSIFKWGNSVLYVFRNWLEKYSQQMFTLHCPLVSTALAADRIHGGRRTFPGPDRHTTGVMNIRGVSLDSRKASTPPPPIALLRADAINWMYSLTALVVPTHTLIEVYTLKASGGEEVWGKSSLSDRFMGE